ncbi:MAG: PAS domain-containing protein [Verrucomicrobiota bacterium]
MSQNPLQREFLTLDIYGATLPEFRFNRILMSQPRAKRNAFTKALAQSLAPAGEAVTVADCNGKIIEANDAVERVYRWPRNQIMGQHPLKFCPDTPEWKKRSEKIWTTINAKGAWDGIVINKDAEEWQFPILLRTRKVVHNGISYVISWARPFPTGAPFDLSKREAEVFDLLGQNAFGAREIAASLGISEGAINTYWARIWEKAGKSSKNYSSKDLLLLAIRCREAGWDMTLKLNQEMLKK